MHDPLADDEGQTFLQTFVLSRDRGGELKIDHKERDPVNDDRRAGTHSTHFSGEHPRGAGEYGAYRNVTHIQPDAHPQKPLETGGAGNVPKVRALPSDARHRADRESPRRYLNGEMLEQRRLKPARHHNRQSSRAAEDGETRPEEESQQMLLLGAKKRIGPHACDASGAPSSEEVRLSVMW